MSASYGAREAVKLAEQIVTDTEYMTRNMAPLLVGNLRHCTRADLRALKRALRRYNTRTWRWKT